MPQGTTSKRLVGNHDIAPTFARIADASVPSFMDGRSFLRIADADPTNDTPWRMALYVERRWEAGWDLPNKSSPQYVPPYEGVREQTRVYLRYRDDPWTAKTDSGFKEFYDLGTKFGPKYVLTALQVSASLEKGTEEQNIVAGLSSGGGILTKGAVGIRCADSYSGPTVTHRTLCAPILG